MNKSEVYLFFAPPRTGNHWVELLISGLYYICPVNIFNKKGKIVNEEELNFTTKTPVIPRCTRQNPTLFLERDQEINKEVVSRAEEIDMDIVKGLVQSCSYDASFNPLYIQWFHEEYHAFPYKVKSPPGISVKYCFVMRSPQATAYSYYKVSQNRWSSETKRKKLTFLDVYTEEWLNDLVKYYQSYIEIADRYQVFIFRYEELKESVKSLEKFCDNFVKQQPKLEPIYVWKLTSFNTLVKPNAERTFYHVGEEQTWLKNLSKNERKKMIEVESKVDFSFTGYPTTREIDIDDTQRAGFKRNRLQKLFFN